MNIALMEWFKTHIINGCRCERNCCVNSAGKVYTHIDIIQATLSSCMQWFSFHLEISFHPLFEQCIRIFYFRLGIGVTGFSIARIYSHHILRQVIEMKYRPYFTMFMKYAKDALIGLPLHYINWFKATTLCLLAHAYEQDHKHSADFLRSSNAVLNGENTDLLFNSAHVIKDVNEWISIFIVKSHIDKKH